MSYILLNIMPILAATAAGLVLGFLWLRIAGRQGGRISAGFGIAAFIAEFWLACILAGALILAPPQAPPLVMALMTPVVIWIGFVVPALTVTLPSRGLGVRAVLSDCGLWLGTMVLQAAVLHAIGLAPPPAA